jgi:hypothetical protein
MTTGEWIDLPMGRARREESGIVYVLIDRHPHQPGENPVEQMLGIIEEQKSELFPQGHAPLLIDAPGLEWLDREQRQAITESESASARAIVARTTAAKATAGAIVAVDRPRVPTRVFSSEAEARAWLEQYL